MLQTLSLPAASHVYLVKLPEYAGISAARSYDLEKDLHGFLIPGLSVVMPLIHLFTAALPEQQSHSWKAMRGLLPSPPQVLRGSRK